MARKKTPQTFLEKLTEKAAHVKEDLIAGRDHLAEVAGDAIASVKHSIVEFRAKKNQAKKPAVKKVGPAEKKSPAKKTATKKKTALKKKTAPEKKTALKKKTVTKKKTAPKKK